MYLKLSPEHFFDAKKHHPQACAELICGQCPGATEGEPVSLKFAHHFAFSYGQGSVIFSMVVSVWPGLGPIIISVMWAFSPQVLHL